MRLFGCGFLAVFVQIGAAADSQIRPLPVSEENVWWAGSRYWTRYHADSLKRIKAGPAEYDCVFLGDSITHNWVGWSDPADVEVVARAYDEGRGPLKFPNGPGRVVWSDLSERYRLLNLAVGGDSTENLLWRLEHGALDGYRARLFALMIGTNDITDDPGRIAAGVRACLAAVRKRHPESKVLLHAILPRDAVPGTRLRRRNDAVNQLIRPLADGRSVYWVDLGPRFLDRNGTLSEKMMPDFLHPLEDGYRTWRAAIEPFFETFASVRFLSATPIWPAGCGETMNESFVFRVRLRMDRPRRATLRLAAVSAYKASLDGKLLAAGPARAPAGFARVDEYPVALEAGEQDLSVLVNSFRCNNFHLPNQAPFLCAELTDGTNVLAATGVSGEFVAEPSERLIKTPRLSFQRGFSEAWRLGCGERSNAIVLAPAGAGVTFLPRVAPVCAFPVASDLEPVGSVRLFRDSTLAPADERCLVGVRPPVFCGYRPEDCQVDVWDELMRWRRTSKENVQTVVGTLYRGAANKTGFLRVELDCTEPGRFIAAFDEIETDGDVNPLRIQVAAGAVWDIVKPGRYVLETAEAHTFRYVRLAQVSGKATWKSPTRILWHNPELFRRTYRGNDPRLAAVYAAGAETLAQNATDVLMDCPSREHAGWLGDSYFSGPAVQKLSGDARTERAFLQDFALGRCPHIPAGMIPMCWPSDHTDGLYISTYAMWFVLEVEDYVRRTGDAATGEILRTKVTDLLRLLATYRNQDGLLEKLPGWVFVGWDRSNDLGQDVSYPANLLYSGCLDAAARLLGEAQFAREADCVRRTVRTQSFKDGLFHDHAVRGADGKLIVAADATETCQYYGFFFGAATPVSDKKLWRCLVESWGPFWKKTMPEKDAVGLFPGELMRLRLLTANGESERAEREIKEYFGRMADRTGTLWEHAAPWASCNHAFAAAVLTEFDN